MSRNYWNIFKIVKKKDFTIIKSDYIIVINEIFTLHENIILSQEKCRYLGELSDRRTVSIRNNWTELIQCIIQIMHSSSFPCIYIQSNAFSLTCAFWFRRTVQSGSSWSAVNETKCMNRAINTLFILTYNIYEDGSRKKN